MPPKKAAKPVDKSKQAAKTKVAEDKTFGLKGGKSKASVRKYVEQVKKQVDNSQKPKQDANAARKAKKEAEVERQKELNELFAEAIKQPKLAVGVDPKSVVCEFFRHGKCTKGFKCKFSHDLNVERRGAKIDIFTERRDAEEEGMEDWDQEQLEKVVNEKHGAEKPTNKTDIICKFFLDAVENKQYGWFWQCPNGRDCKYRHALPPGYILKSQMRELIAEEAANRQDIEDAIEEERAKVDAKTPITQTVFEEWRRSNVDARAKERQTGEADRKKRGQLTGREIFMQEGFMVEDDLGAADDYVLENDEEEEFRRARAAAEAENARRRAEAGDAGSSAEAWQPLAQNGTGHAKESRAGPSGSAASAARGHELTEEEEALFDDDDLDDSDVEDEDLERLEAQLGGAGLAE